jgi:hypothetical protein
MFAVNVVDPSPSEESLCCNRSVFGRMLNHLQVHRVVLTLAYAECCRDIAAVLEYAVQRSVGDWGRSCKTSGTYGRMASNDFEDAPFPSVH